jgi:AraC-like DNA-binding protein
LNKRAAHDGSPAALWHIEDHRSIFAGPLRYNAAHSHSVPVLIGGLYGKFSIRRAGAAWTLAQAAVVDAGVPYELDVGGEPVSVIYLEPSTGGSELLQPLLGAAEATPGVLIGQCRVRSLLRELYEDGYAVGWAGEALDDVLRVADRGAGNPLDPRIARVVSSLRQETQSRPASMQAAAVGLSSSRFQHLFAAEVGVPFRRYRSWCRLRTAIREVVKGRSLTTAAHAAGFADQAHFSRVFRRTFGAPPSASLTCVRS